MKSFLIVTTLMGIAAQASAADAAVAPTQCVEKPAVDEQTFLKAKPESYADCKDASTATTCKAEKLAAWKKSVLEGTLAACDLAETAAEKAVADGNDPKDKAELARVKAASAQLAAQLFTCAKPYDVSSEKARLAVTRCDTSPDPLCLSNGVAEWKKTQLTLFIAQCKTARLAGETPHKRGEEQVTAAQKELDDLNNALDAATMAPDNSTKPWLTRVSFGQQYLPSYKDGQSNGFDESQAYMQIVVDSRWAHDPTKGEGLFYHWGAFVTMDGQVVKGIKKQGNTPTPFEQVADRMTTGLYYFSEMDGTCALCFLPAPKFGKLDDDGRSYRSAWSWGGKLGFRTLDTVEYQDGNEKKRIGDTVDPFLEFGFRYQYTEFEKRAANAMPRGGLNIGLAYWGGYEDSIGEKDSDARLRFAVAGEYRLSDTVPAFLGVRGNLGKGKDDTSLYFELRFNSQTLLGMLTDSK